MGCFLLSIIFGIMTLMIKIIQKIKENDFLHTILNSIIIFFLIVTISYLFIQIIKIQKKTEENKSELSQKITDIETVLLANEEKNTTFAEALKSAEEKSQNLERAFDKVSDNVDELETITKTDPELLQKYSKISFLNENYIPTDLKIIPSEYTYIKTKSYEIHERVYPYLIRLLKAAKENDLDLQVISAFRSFGEQAQLKGIYTVNYGAGTANQFSADQGYSEHQLGTTLDFTNTTIGATFSGFSKSAEFKWLQDNAYKYGFVLSYPENNQYYEYEPWHWRFVGEDLAEDLHDDGKYFYDLTQREIDEYVVKLFD